MNGSYPPIEYRPRFMWDVGASEQEITNVMEGIGGRGGYGTLSPPAMGWYGAESTLHLKTTGLIGGLVVAGACFLAGKHFGGREEPLLYSVGIGALLAIGFLSLGGYEKNL